VFTEELIPVGDLRLNVASGPRNGPPLWLLHGLIRRWQDFGPIIPGLTPRWTVRGHDHRGHGRSDRADSYHVPDYAADAAALLTDLSEPAVLVGHSLGALLALDLAAKHPDRVAAAVLLDPPGGGFIARIAETPYAVIWGAMKPLAGGERPTPDIARALADIRVPTGKPGETARFGDQRDAAALRFVAGCLRAMDPAALAPAVEGGWLGGFDTLATAARVTCPVLLVAGDPRVGGMLPPADADPLAAALADCTRVELPGVGHLPHTQDPGATLTLLHAFLDAL
jgi:pimeloyl-ACP methyl ester carboxylesterase